MEFKELIGALFKINNQLQEQSIRAVNTSLSLRNWFFGYYIFEFEQNGNDRADYGKALLANIANAMAGLHIPNTDERELRRCRQFYIAYPNAAKIIFSDTQISGFLPIDFYDTHIKLLPIQIRGSVNPELNDTHIENNINQIRGTVSPELNDTHIENNTNQIRGTVSPELNDTHIENNTNQIRGTVSPELNIPDTHYITLFKKISYSHFIELISITNPLKRLFYELECIKGTWSVRELKRQIGSLLYERTGLSDNKEKLLALTHQKSTTLKFPDLIRDPYIFEFLGLKPTDVLLEKDLEQALIDHLLHFILELGKGFCFETRQKRILIDNEHHFIDLVFYHRLLHCNVLIELKTEKFNYTHASQLNMYLEYYKKYEMAEGDSPPVGILLCTHKDQEHVEFATAGMEDKVFVSQYLVALPAKQELEQFIKNQLKIY